MGTKKTPPGAASEPTTTDGAAETAEERGLPAPAPTFPTALHYIGKRTGRYLAELGQRDHSEAAMQSRGRDLWQAALDSGLYRPTTAHVRDRGMPDPAHIAPRKAQQESTPDGV